MKRVVITGPTGAIGMALIQKCIEEGIAVLAVCRPDSQRSDRIPKHPLVKCIFCRMTDYKIVEVERLGKYDVFYHLAWAATTGAERDDMELQLKNVEYSLAAVQLAERLGCKTFIGAGSQAEYGPVEGEISETTPTNPVLGYGIAKLCAGQMTRKECAKRGIKHIWVRVLSVYGPYDNERSMIPIAIRALLKKEYPVFTKGEQMWDYLYSFDAAEALLLMANKGKNGATYVLGSGAAKPLKEYLYQLRDSIDNSLELGIGKVPYAENQVMYLKADISKLTEDTGFVPKVIFSDGIKETIDWVIKEVERKSQA